MKKLFFIMTMFTTCFFMSSCSSDNDPVTDPEPVEPTPTDPDSTQDELFTKAEFTELVDKLKDGTSSFNQQEFQKSMAELEYCRQIYSSYKSANDETKSPLEIIMNAFNSFIKGDINESAQAFNNFYSREGIYVADDETKTISKLPLEDGEELNNTVILKYKNKDKKWNKLLISWIKSLKAREFKKNGVTGSITLPKTMVITTLDENDEEIYSASFNNDLTHESDITINCSINSAESQIKTTARFFVSNYNINFMLKFFKENNEIGVIQQSVEAPNALKHLFDDSVETSFGKYTGKLYIPSIEFLCTKKINDLSVSYQAIRDFQNKIAQSGIDPTDTDIKNLVELLNKNSERQIKLHGRVIANVFYAPGVYNKDEITSLFEHCLELKDCESIKFNEMIKGDLYLSGISFINKSMLNLQTFLYNNFGSKVN